MITSHGWYNPDDDIEIEIDIDEEDIRMMRSMFDDFMYECMSIIGYSGADGNLKECLEDEIKEIIKW